MNKIVIVCGLALTLAGCNTTVYTPRPVITVETRPTLVVPPVYERLPPPRPYIEPRRQRCYSTWDNTPRGYHERVICR